MAPARIGCRCQRRLQLIKSPLQARIDGYEIEDLVGEGGIGRVYRARDTQLGRTVAIKIMSPTLAVDPNRLHRFAGCCSTGRRSWHRPPQER